MNSSREQGQWFEEINRYAPRVAALPDRIHQALGLISSLGLTAPMETRPDDRTVLIVQLIAFNTGSLRVSYDLTKAATLLFGEGRITSTCLQFRLIYEFWGATAFAARLCERARDELTIDEVASSVNRLVHGSRTPVRLPWGGETGTTSFNVMNFIQHLEKVEPGSEANYSFLCEACHPSHFQQFYFWMAGSDGDNWTNEVFREHAHTLLERLIAIGESASAGLATATERIVAISRPFVADLN